MGVLLVLVVAGTAVAPAAVAAATDGGIVLADHVLSSVAVDLDGDGSKEIVAIVSDPEEPATLRVGAWGVRDGTWVALGQDVVEGWDASDETSRTSHLNEETAVLLVVGDGDEQRVIVAVGKPYTDNTTPGACCLSFGRVHLVAGALRFEPVPGDFGSADSIFVVDLEADGRSELLLSMSIPNEVGPWETTYRLLRKAGDGFAAEPVTVPADDIPDDSVVYFNVAADMDGRRGDELLFMTDDNRWLYRASRSADAGLQFERAVTKDLFDTRFGGWIVGAADGVLVVVSGRNIVTARWPAGGAIEPAARVTTDNDPSIYLVGSGSNARLVEVDGLGDPAIGLGMSVYDLDLTVEQELDAPIESLHLWQTLVNVQNQGETALGNAWPEVGVIPGGLPDGRAGFLGVGQMLAMGSASRPEVHGATQLVGGLVMGLVGPDSAWLAHGEGWYGLDTTAYLGGTGFTPDALAPSRVTVMPAESVIGTGSADGIDVGLDGAVFVDSAEGPRLFTGPDGFHATIAGDPGTRVATVSGGQSEGAVIEDDSVTIAIEPGGRRDLNWQQTIGLIVVSPAGIARMIEWDLTTLRLPPEVSAESSFALFDGHATVAGNVGLGTSVIVDGRAVETAADGSYRVDVDASPWPHDIAVVARDPLGVEVVRHIEVVGFVDVRALPWVPIIIALTLAAGVVLFIRTPSLRPGDRLLPDGDGRLEELDGDGI